MTQWCSGHMGACAAAIAVVQLDSTSATCRLLRARLITDLSA
ncbi:hypothetical protein I546_5498 [Mycobacterium kansasii 732]|nr:hypothetical protein I546_5498 [Mycobacterium kansasii 732]